MNYKYYSKSYKEKDYKELLEYGLDSFIMSLYNPYISSKYWKGKKKINLWVHFINPWQCLTVTTTNSSVL